MRYYIFLVTFGVLGGVWAHGNHAQQPLSPDATWAAKHMLEEHHISSFDAGSFFNLHDYDSSHDWTQDEIAKTYGLKDKSTAHITQEERDTVVKKVIELYDRDQSGTISYAEYVVAEASGIHLPDFGFGPGHHGDDEYEYEIHHFEKFHGPDTTLEDLTHPEDIEHFRMHELEEEAAERQVQLDSMSIVLANIPQKFRRGA